jgi:hypothetical protein
VQQPDDGEHHEHDPQADAQRRRCARLVVLVRAFVVEIVGAETVRPVPGEQQHREAEARHREDDPPPAEHGGAAVGEEAPDRSGQVGSEPEHREHADDDERHRERVGAVPPQLTSGCLATPLPGRRARRSAPASVATALRADSDGARAGAARASTVTPASPDSAAYPGHWARDERRDVGYSAGSSPVDRVHLAGDPLGGVAAQQDGQGAGSVTRPMRPPVRLGEAFSSSG